MMSNKPLTGSGADLDYLNEFEELVKEFPVDTGSDDPFAHYVTKEDMMRGMVYGEPVMAICGKIWIPARDGSNYPVCPECKEIYDSIPDGDNNEEDY